MEENLLILVFDKFFDENGIEHNFAFPRASPQNGIVERKNRTLQDMARTMLNEFNISKTFWAEAVNTACYVSNHVYIHPAFKKTPYELWNDKTPKIDYFRVFGCKCFILNTLRDLDHFYSKYDEGIFIGYSERSKAYRVYNKATLRVEETLHVKFIENSLNSSFKF